MTIDDAVYALTRKASLAVTVDGVLLATGIGSVNTTSIDVSFDLNVIPPTASIGMPKIPGFILRDMPVTIEAGYDGFLERIFTGIVKRRVHGVDDDVLECVGRTGKLTRPYIGPNTVQDPQGIGLNKSETFLTVDAESAIRRLLTNVLFTEPTEQINIDAAVSDLIIGGARVAVLDIGSVSDMIHKIADIDGNRIYESRSGELNIRPLLEAPAPLGFRTYSTSPTGAVEGVTDETIIFDDSNIDTALNLGDVAANEQRSQSFLTNNAGQLQQITVWLRKVASPTDTVQLRLFEDGTTGDPDGNQVGGQDIAGSVLVTTGYTRIDFAVSTDVPLLANTLYHLVIDRSGAVDAVNYYQLGSDSTGGYADGSSQVFNGSTWSSATGDLVFETLQQSTPTLRIVDIGDEEDEDQIKRVVTVEGATLESTDAEGNATQERIEQTAYIATEELVSGPPGLHTAVYQNELIDNDQQAAKTALRLIDKFHRVIQNIEVEVPFDPKIDLGATITIDDPAVTGITGNWWIRGYQHSLSEGVASTHLSLFGGDQSGSTGILIPQPSIVCSTETQLIGPSLQAFVTCTATVSAIGSPIVDYSWTDNYSGGSTTQNGPALTRITRAYDPGEQEVIIITLTVTDALGTIGVATAEVRITSERDEIFVPVISVAAGNTCMATFDGAQTWIDISTPAGVAKQTQVTFRPDGTVEPMPLKQGKYTGNGTSQFIEVGFPPEFVMLRRATNATPDDTLWKATHMPNTASKPLGSVRITTGITQLSPSGFLLGADGRANALGVEYHYIALANPPDGTPIAFKTGTYTGDGTTPRIISVPGVEIRAVICGGGAVAEAFKTSNMSGTICTDIGLSNLLGAEVIRAIRTGEFEVGSSSIVNANGTIMDWVAFGPGAVAVGNYAGTGADNFEVTTSMRPSWGIVKKVESGESDDAYMKFASQTGDESQRMTNDAVIVADRIQQLNTVDFQVGVAENTSGHNYEWMMLAASGETGAVGDSPTVLFFGTDGGNIYRSVDRLASLQLVYDDVDNDEVTLIRADREIRQRIWATTTDRVLRSEDYGATWEVYSNFNNTVEHPDRDPGTGHATTGKIDPRPVNGIELSSPSVNKIWIYGGNGIDPESWFAQSFIGGARTWKSKVAEGAGPAANTTGSATDSVIDMAVSNGASGDLALLFDGVPPNPPYKFSEEFIPIIDADWHGSANLTLPAVDGRSIASNNGNLEAFGVFLDNTNFYRSQANQGGLLFETLSAVLPGTGANRPHKLLHIPGFQDVFLGGTIEGVIKTLDFGETWDFIRPVGAPFSTTWPGGAVGYDVDIEFRRPRTSATTEEIYVQAELIDYETVVLGSGDSWIEQSDDLVATGSTLNLKAIGDNLYRIHDVDVYGPVVGGEGKLQRSPDGGITWTTVFEANPNKVATGTYTGNGSSLSVTGVGFEPDLVIVFNDDQAAVIKGHDSVWGTASAEMDGEWIASAGIISLDVDGFSVGSDVNVNQSGETHYYLAIKNDSIVTGSYTATGAASSIAGVGYRPEMVWAFNSGASSPGVIKTETMTTTESAEFAATAFVTDEITSLDTDGFSIGTGDTVNDSGDVVYWIAFPMASQIEVATYNGNGSDNRTITATDYNYIMVLGDIAQQKVHSMQSLQDDDPLTNSGDASHEISDTGDIVANLIQGTLPTSFQVGDDSRVNAGTSESYHWIGFRDDLLDGSIESGVKDVAQAADGSLWLMWGTRTDIDQPLRVYKSVDDGVTWSLIFDQSGTDGTEINLSTGNIACHPTDTDRVAVLCYKNIGATPRLLVTVDGGANWTEQTGLVNGGVTNSHRVQWGDAGRLIVATGGARIETNDNDGAAGSWVERDDDAGNSVLQLIKFSPSRLAVMYGAIGGNGGQIKISDDNGQTWRELVTGVQLFSGMSGGNGMCVDGNGGLVTSWADGGGSGFTIFRNADPFAAIPPPWTNLTFDIEAVMSFTTGQNPIACLRNEPTNVPPAPIMVMESDIGGAQTYSKNVARFINSGWESRDAPSSASNFPMLGLENFNGILYRIESVVSTPGYRNTDRGNLFRSGDAGTSWVQVGPSADLSGGEWWGISSIALAANGYLWATVSGREPDGETDHEPIIIRSIDDGLTWSTFLYKDTEIAGGGRWNHMARITCHPLNKDIVFVSGGANIGIWRSWLSENAADAVPTFTQYTTSGPSQSLNNRDWGCQMFDTGRVVVTRGGGASFFYSDNLGKTSWVSVNTSFTTATLMDLERAGLTGGMAFGSGIRGSNPRIIRTVDYGTSWDEIVNESVLAGFPAGLTQIRALAYDANTDTLYVSTDSMDDTDAVWALDNATTFFQGFNTVRAIDPTGLNIHFANEVGVGGIALQ